MTPPPPRIIVPRDKWPLPALRGSTVTIIVPIDKWPLPSLFLVLQLESLCLETNDPSPPVPGSQLELLFLETNDPRHQRFPSKTRDNEEALWSSLGLNVFPVMSQKYFPTCRYQWYATVSWKGSLSQILYSRNILPGNKWPLPQALTDEWNYPEFFLIVRCTGYFRII